MSPPLRNRVIPGISERTDFPLMPEKTALLVIDIQRYLSDPSTDEFATEKPYLYQVALPNVISNISKLLTAFRQVRDTQYEQQQQNESATTLLTGCEVIFTYLQAATKNGRDISLDYKLSGPLLAEIPRASASGGLLSLQELFLPECMPDMHTGAGDILLPKTSCSVFQSTNLDYLLRQLCIEQLVVTGQLTDQCVESAVRDAADLGYLVTVASDACASTSEANHEKGLHGMKGFCRLVSTTQVVQELENAVVEKQQKEMQESVQDEGVVKSAELEKLSHDKVLEYLRDQCLDDLAEFMERALQDQQKTCHPS